MSIPGAGVALQPWADSGWAANTGENPARAFALFGFKDQQPVSHELGHVLAGLFLAATADAGPAPGDAPAL